MALESTGRVSSTLKDKPSLSFSTESSDMKKLIQSNGIYDRYQMNWNKKFSRFGIIDPYNVLTSTREYIFITKPDLCILNSNGELSSVLSSNAFFTDAVRRYKDVAAQLQSSYSSGDGPFITMLSNSITSHLDLPGLSADSIDSASNIMGTKISYRGSSIKSDYDHDFSLEFEDTKHLDIYMLFKMYDEYEKLKWKGYIDFTKAETDRWINYIINKVLHDQMSIYKIVVAEDGYRIVYWARVTGCHPTSAPRDAFSDMTDALPQKLTVSWKGHFVRDMDPIILAQFNNLVSQYTSNKEELPLFDMDINRISGDWSSMPYIDTKYVKDPYRSESSRVEYFLRWVK